MLTHLTDIGTDGLWTGSRVGRSHDAQPGLVPHGLQSLAELLRAAGANKAVVKQDKAVVKQDKAVVKQ